MLRHNLALKQYFLEVDLAHLLSFDEELATLLTDKPAENLALVQK
jgi:DNA replication licensing factor MCM5